MPILFQNKYLEKNLSYINFQSVIFEVLIWLLPLILLRFNWYETGKEKRVLLLMSWKELKLWTVKRATLSLFFLFSFASRNYLFAQSSSWFCISHTDFAEGALCRSRSLMKKLSNAGLSADPMGTPLATGLQLSFVPPATTLWAQQRSQSFNPPHRPFRMYISGLSKSIWWETGSKALLKARLTI